MCCIVIPQCSITFIRDSEVKKTYVRPLIQTIVDPPPDLSNRRRSQRVVLQMLLLLRTELADGRKVRVRAFTLVVNAHGGLLKSPLMLPANHKIALVNPQTGKEAWCKVIRSERSSPDTVSLAFEFHEPSATFWPISFPPEDWERS